MVMSGQSFVCLICCFMSTVNSYGHVWTVICLFDVALRPQKTVMVMSGQSFVCLICCFMSTVNSYGHVWTVICLFDVLLYVQGKQLWSCQDGHLFV